MNCVLLTVLFKKIPIFTSKNKKMSFIWPLREYLNSNPKNTARIVFSDPKNIKKSLVPKDLTKIFFFKMADVAILDLRLYQKTQYFFKKNFF